MLIMAPADENECRQMLSTGYYYEGPAAVRYPRGTGPGVETSTDLSTLSIGQAQVRRQGKKVAILAFGSMVLSAEQTAQELDATVINMRFIKPLDTSMIEDMAVQHELIITIEENTVLGGAGSAVAEYLNSIGNNTAIKHIGLPDIFLDHGQHKQMLSSCGLDAAGIIATVQQHFAA
jgi:1-deoxy-D-xylulose-5-phosphate synthase